MLTFLLPLFLFAACEGNGSSADDTAETMADSTAVDTTVMEDAPPRLTRARNVFFNETLESGKLKFHVNSPNVDQQNTLVVASEGMEVRDDTFQIIIQGRVTDAQIADLNADTYPELYVFTATPDEAKRGEVYAFASYANRTYGEVYVPAISEDDPMMQDYTGQDEFELVDTALIRRFPLSSGRRSLIYKLEKGEANFRLEARPMKQEGTGTQQ